MLNLKYVSDAFVKTDKDSIADALVQITDEFIEFFRSQSGTPITKMKVLEVIGKYRFIEPSKEEFIQELSQLSDEDFEQFIRIVDAGERFLAGRMQNFVDVSEGKVDRENN